MVKKIVIGMLIISTVVFGTKIIHGSRMLNYGYYAQHMLGNGCW